MKRFTLFGLAALVGALALADTADAGLFGRFRGFRYQPRATVGYRAAGHTEATGVGTPVDGTPRHATPPAGPRAPTAVRAEGHTEATGTGTAVDGR